MRIRRTERPCKAGPWHMNARDQTRRWCGKHHVTQHPRFPPRIWLWRPSHCHQVLVGDGSTMPTDLHMRSTIIGNPVSGLTNRCTRLHNTFRRAHDLHECTGASRHPRCRCREHSVGASRLGYSSSRTSRKATGLLERHKLHLSGDMQRLRQ